MPEKIGYARVSTPDQNLARQRDGLKRAGCHRVYADKRSGKNRNRPALSSALERLRPGDTLVFWSVDRLGRNLEDLLDIEKDLRQRGVVLHDGCSAIDTTTPDGWYHWVMEAANAERTRRKISLATREGIRALKLRGKQFGRKRAMSAGQVERARRLRLKGLTVRAIARQMGLAKSTVHRALTPLGNTP